MSSLQTLNPGIKQCTILIIFCSIFVKLIAFFNILFINKLKILEKYLYGE